MKWIVLLSFMVISGAKQHNSRLAPFFNKIYGGHDTTIENYPYAVQLMMRQDPFEDFTFLCGGSVLTSRHVLTAAHCLEEHSDDSSYDEDTTEETTLQKSCASSIFARVGSATLLAGGSVHQASTLTLHPGYSTYSGANDIGVVLLMSPVSYNSKVQPAILPPQGRPAPNNAIVKIVGWGQTPTILASKVLLEATIRIVSQTECKNRYDEIENEGDINTTVKMTPRWVVNSQMICAGLLDVGVRGVCYGDSGGPLIYEKVVIGVTSWGEECADPKYPELYTKVSNYTNWINEVPKL